MKFLKSRTVRRGDGQKVAELWKQSAPVHSALEPNLPQVFDAIFEAEAGVGIITEEGNASGSGSKCVGFTHMAFIRDEGMAAYLQSPKPGMANALLQTVNKNCLGVFMDRKEQAEANLGDGISHALIALAATPMDLAHPDFTTIFNELYTNYLQNVRGYNIKCVYAEVDVMFKDFMVAAGLVPVQRIEGRTAANGIKFPADASVERWLMKADRGNTHLHHAMSAAVLMSYIKPAFRFTPSEQRMLLQAIEGLNDVEVAKALGISRDAVKSAWKTIYAHVEDAMPELFAGHDAMNGEARGSEKRRRVIAHVRTNLQELRPHYSRRGKGN